MLVDASCKLGDWVGKGTQNGTEFDFAFEACEDCPLVFPNKAKVLEVSVGFTAPSGLLAFEEVAPESEGHTALQIMNAEVRFDGEEYLPAGIGEEFALFTGP